MNAARIQDPNFLQLSLILRNIQYKFIMLSNIFLSFSSRVMQRGRLSWVEDEISREK